MLNFKKASEVQTFDTHTKYQLWRDNQQKLYVQILSESVLSSSFSASCLLFSVSEYRLKKEYGYVRLYGICLETKMRKQSQNNHDWYIFRQILKSTTLLS